MGLFCIVGAVREPPVRVIGFVSFFWVAGRAVGGRNWVCFAKTAFGCWRLAVGRWPGGKLGSFRAAGARHAMPVRKLGSFRIFWLLAVGWAELGSFRFFVSPAGRLGVEIGFVS